MPIQVVDLDVHSKVLELDDGRTVMFEKLLLATGGRPKSLPVFDNAEEAVRDRVIHFRTVRPAPGPTSRYAAHFVPVLSAFHPPSDKPDPQIDDFKHLREAALAGKDIAIVGGGFLGR
jgi:NADPH-dependent 2,4-dienoyl-CoA reductase/sulfur reductase-like enzyme